MFQQYSLVIVTLMHPGFIVEQPGVPTLTSVTVVAQQLRQVIVALSFEFIAEQRHVPAVSFGHCYTYTP
jgi:hypothetical protein